MKVRIGSRGSKLAVTQAHWVGDQLKQKNASLDISYQTIQTQGDRDANASLAKIGGKGVFVKEIEGALLKKEIDVAVHSLKDVPQMLASGLELAAYPKREDPQDAVVSRFGELISELPKGSTVGTSSPRRAAQIEQKFKNRYRLEPIRGNVETRLKKLHDGQYDAIVLAAAGIKRLGLEDEITEVLEAPNWLPAPGQGCLGLEIRSDEKEFSGLLQTISDSVSDLTARAERAFLQALGGSCNVPVAGLASVNGEQLSMVAILLDPKSDKHVRREEKGNIQEAELIGAKLAGRILHDGGSEILINLP